MVFSETLRSSEIIDPKQLVGTFSGQGSQFPGMGKDLYLGSPVAREVFEEADDVLGRKFSELMFSGSENELNDTRNAQPAMLIHGVAAMRVFEKETGMKASSLRYLAGHSVGEYTAIVASGAVNFRDALRLVYERGRSMWDASRLKEGYMAAILGQDMSHLEEICQQKGIEIANDNCPGQTVLSGGKVSMDGAVKMLLDEGVNSKRIVPLRVSGAFHSKLMLPAVEEMRGILTNIKFKDPETRIISNVTEKPISEAKELPDELLKQLYSCVRWNGSVNGMVNDGARFLLEFGPGQVLTNLAKRIAGDKAKAINLGTLAAIRSFASKPYL